MTGSSESASAPRSSSRQMSFSKMLLLVSIASVILSVIYQLAITTSQLTEVASILQKPPMNSFFQGSQKNGAPQDKLVTTATDTTTHLRAKADESTMETNEQTKADEQMDTESDHPTEAEESTSSKVTENIKTEAANEPKESTKEVEKATETKTSPKKGKTLVGDAKGKDSTKAAESTKIVKKAAKSKKNNSKFDVCIVGAGLSGSVLADRHSTLRKESVLVMEKRDHIGGNCYDYIDEDTGIRVSKYGAHLFHTKYDRVWEYVQQFSNWTPYEHHVQAFVNGKHVPVPVNIDTVNALFDLNITSSEEMDKWLKKEQVHLDHEPKNSEEVSLTRVGERLYNTMFKPYTIKQWAKTPAELGPEVMARIPVRNNHDGRYFSDPYQALPTEGYTAIFEKMLLANPLIEVRLNTDYFKVRDSLECGRWYFTGPIDAYFAHLGWKKLEYRSLDFRRQVVYNTTYFQPLSVVNHPSADVEFTRIVEYKHLLNQSSPHTVYFEERSTDDGEPYYPVPNPENQALFARYKKMALKEPNVVFVGRLANYKYFNMDQSILNALELYDEQTSPEKGKTLVGDAKGKDSTKAAESTKIVKKAAKSKKNNSKFDVCIVGAGLSGSVLADRHSTLRKESVLVMEKRDHIGGNCYDYIDEDTGIRVSKYGAHLFHTKYDRVWEYVQQFSNWTPYEHHVQAFVNGKHVPVPVNIDTVNALFDLNITSSEEMDKWLKKEQVHLDHEPKNSEEVSLTRVGERLYNTMFKPYTIKQWAKTPAELGPEVMARIPVRNNHDGRYFSDPYQALPTEGYTAIFEKMLLANPLIEVRLNTDYFKVRDSLECGRWYFTGPIDAYFAHLGWKKLEYRSLDFRRQVVYNTTYFQPLSVVNHPSADVEFTRIVEYKHLLNQSSPHTVYFEERSTDDGEPYYPVPNPENQALFARYKKMALKEPNVVFVGRLANYKYFNMDQSILNALELYDEQTSPKKADQ